ncbi:MAG: hypothetical protein ACREFK_12475 [Stellaceae bacterium]
MDKLANLPADVQGSGKRRYCLIAALDDSGAQAFPIRLTERGNKAWALPRCH